MNIIWSPTSRRKIEEIVDYIATDNLEAALELVDEFNRRVADLNTHPRSGRMVPVLNDEMVRELIVRKDYLIVYEIHDELIKILTIRHAKQDFNESDLNLE